MQTSRRRCCWESSGKSSEIKTNRKVCRGRLSATQARGLPWAGGAAGGSSEARESEGKWNNRHTQAQYMNPLHGNGEEALAKQAGGQQADMKNNGVVDEKMVAIRLFLVFRLCSLFALIFYHLPKANDPLTPTWLLFSPWPPTQRCLLQPLFHMRPAKQTAHAPANHGSVGIANCSPANPFPHPHMPRLLKQLPTFLCRCFSSASEGACWLVFAGIATPICSSPSIC
ncbi:hypothetical protein GQ54DRAFT_23948 [Martensiomyces pterosporus]|nr:hypothetical protein GQ54DRAFT_23948 [Martensiomyces pterosporus]